MFVKLHWWATTQDWGIWRPSQIPNHHLKFNSWILLHGTAAWLDATQAFLPWLPWQVGKPFGNETINEPRWPSCGFFLSNVSKVPIRLAEIPEVETLWPESLQVELSFCNFWVHNWAIMSSCCHHIPWVAIVRHSRCKRGRSQGALFSGCEIVCFFLAYLCFSHICRGIKCVKCKCLVVMMEFLWWKHRCKASSVPNSSQRHGWIEEKCKVVTSVDGGGSLQIFCSRYVTKLSHHKKISFGFRMSWWQASLDESSTSSAAKQLPDEFESPSPDK